MVSEFVLSQQSRGSAAKFGFSKWGRIFGVFVRSVYKELHADHETGAADNK